MLGETRSAIRALRRAIEQGFFCYPYMATDPLLDSIRGQLECPTAIEIARTRNEQFKKRFLLYST
jgi:hypothetical protein